LDAAAPLALQRAHQAAANDADDDLSRAHHLSRAGGGANEERAALLERASDIALARDDVLSGQLLAQAAVDATPQREGHEAPWSRWAALARAQARGGGVQDPVIGALTRTATTPDHHAMSLLYTAEGRLDDINDVVRLSQQAASYPGVSTAVRARALTLLAHHMLFRGARLDEAFRVATDAATTASEVAEHQPTPDDVEHRDLARPGDELELAKSLTLASYVGRLAGVPCDPTMLERAEILQGNHALFGPDAVSVHGFLSVLDDDHDGARRELTRAKRQTGGLSHIPGLYLAELECRVGHLGAARHLIEESDAPALRASMVFVLAMVAAWEGDRELCFQWVLRGNELCQITRDTIHPHGFRTASALLELGSGDAEAAWHTATSTSDALETIAFAEPSVFPVLPVAIEASAMTGRVAEAERLVTRLERQAAALESRWAAACALRGRALIAGTLGDVEAGMALAGLSVEKFDELGLPTEAGRSALAAGHLARRAGQRITSRTWLQGAIDRLEPHGVAGFTAQARAELARVSGRSAGGNLLTPSELQVAEIAASGASNAQISASLFLSVKTVETHLSRIYRKLGVRSRAELASRWETLRPDVAGRPGH
jgi:DNA-binding CsgD family transcriptional regulator